jgi:hypothetical protein
MFLDAILSSAVQGLTHGYCKANIFQKKAGQKVVMPLKFACLPFPRRVQHALRKNDEVIMYARLH